MQPNSVILIEFNELSPALLDRFMGEGLLPNFKALYGASVIFTTDAGEDPPNLEPWIQWPTVHSGLPYSEHGVFNLGDGRKQLTVKLVGEVLSDAGIPVGICSSMNLNYCDLRGYVIPDPWDIEGRTWPATLQPFYRTIAHAVQESSKGGGPSAKDLLSFGAFLLRHGVRPSTVRSVLAQLMNERRSSGLRWRRASLLDDLQYDVFRSLNRRFRVRFATFFSNSTAHYQHYHWRNMEPELFDVPPPEEDDPSFADAIRYGYRSMDRLIGRFLVDQPDAMLVLCTALSQQPWIETTKCIFRPRSFTSLFEFAGLDATEEMVKPVMAQQFHLELPSAEMASRARVALLDMVVDGTPVMSVRQNGPNLFAGCELTDYYSLTQDVERLSDGARMPFKELFYMIHTMRSGWHHRDGALWFRTGQHKRLNGRVPLTDIAPTILHHFGVPQPAHMKGRPLPITAQTVRGAPQ